MPDRRCIAMIAACPFPWPRGTPIRIHRMAEALALRGHDVHVLTYHLGRPLTEPGFAIHRIGAVESYTHTAPGPTLRKLVQLDPRLTRLLRRLQTEHSFDVLHAHHYEGLLVALGARRGPPLVYDAHTTLAGELPHYPLGLPRWITRWLGAVLDRTLPRRADHTIAVSTAIRDRLVGEGGLSPERVSVIPNGVDWRRFDVPVGRARSEPTLIFTGNLAPYQGVDRMLAAFARVRERRPQARLLVVTESAFDPFEAQARALGIRDAIEILPASIDEQPALLAAADVALNPRVLCDGIPQKLLNYMAAGKAIVSFDGSAVHLVHERTGLRVPGDRPEAMAAAIERLLDDRELAARLGAAAREQVRREFSWDGVAARVEQVYARVSAARAAGRAAKARESAAP